jgi:hypothetical protein
MPLTASQIVTLACQTAHAPGFIVQAGQLLNSILSELTISQDMDLTRGTFNFNLTPGNGSGPYQLPLTYLRHTRDGVFYTIDGVPYFLTPYEQAEFDALVTTAGLSNFPEAFWTDTSPLAQNPASNPLMYVWQPPNGTYAMTVRYVKSQPDIVTPETSSVIPWFPHQGYLLRRLSGEIMAITDDTRAEEFLTDAPGSMGAGAMLRTYMQMQAQDDEGRAKTVNLDARRFGRGSKLPDTKAVGFFTS